MYISPLNLVRPTAQRQTRVGLEAVRIFGCRPSKDRPGRGLILRYRVGAKYRNSCALGTFLKATWRRCRLDEFRFGVVCCFACDIGDATQAKSC